MDNMVNSVMDKERMIRLNISLEKIADELEKHNKLKEKELEFLQYQSEIMLKEYELDIQRNMSVKEELDGGYSTNTGHN